jgi:hypothetical protein
MFVPGKPLQPSLMFAGEARSLPKSGAPARFINLVGSGKVLHSGRLRPYPQTLE